MPTSINSAQKSLLSTNKLDNHGSEDKPQAFNLDATQQALVNVAGILALAANDNLHKDGNIGSGALAESIEPGKLQVSGNNISLDILALDYYDYVNSGVKGIKGGSGKYSFKYARPSAKMVAAIKAWIDNGKITTANTKPAKSKYKTEQKNGGISRLNNEYAVAQAIVNKGIKGTGFLDRAIKTATDAADEQLSSGLVIDIINTIPSKIE